MTREKMEASVKRALERLAPTADPAVRQYTVSLILGWADERVVAERDTAACDG